MTIRSKEFLELLDAYALDANNDYEFNYNKICEYVDTHNYETLNKGWLEKTDWVQENITKFHVWPFGHRADVMVEEIKYLWEDNNRLYQMVIEYERRLKDKNG